jgi:hypothetical protein
LHQIQKKSEKKIKMWVWTGFSMFVIVDMRWIQIILCIILMNVSTSVRAFIVDNKNPPERLNILERIESSKWLNFSAKWILQNHSMSLLNREDVEVLSTLSKKRMLEESEIGTAGVILYEFATGDGPSTRYFSRSDKFTTSFKQSPGVQYLLKQYVATYSGDSFHFFDSCNDVLNYRYQFSPVYKPLDLNTWDFSLKQHFETWDKKNFSQIILGSFNADIQYVNDSTIRIHAWNRTSKKSLYGGFGKRWQRPLPLGTTTQHFTFKLTLSDLRILQIIE